MKYECVNCLTCCLSANSQGSYCALQSQCTQPLISYQQAIGFTIIIVFLLAAALACLYLAFRNRQLPQDKSPLSQPPQSQPKDSEQPSQPKIKKSVRREKIQQIKRSEELIKASRVSSSRRTKVNGSVRSTPKKSTTEADTERGLRSPTKQ